MGECEAIGALEPFGASKRVIRSRTAHGIFAAFATTFEPMRPSSRLIPYIVVVCLGCAPGCECCPPDVSTVDSGALSDGVVPSNAFAPLLGDYAATLTWTVPNRVTTLHLDITNPSNSETVYPDCEGHDVSFEAQLNTHVYTDDGVLDLTMGMPLSFGVDLVVPDQMLELFPSFDTLKADGVTPAYAYDGFDIEFDVPIVNLMPKSTTIWMTSDPQEGQPFRLATVVFGPGAKEADGGLLSCPDGGNAHDCPCVVMGSDSASSCEDAGAAGDGGPGSL